MTNPTNNYVRPTMTSTYYFYDVLSSYKVTPEQLKKQQEEWKEYKQKLMEQEEQDALETLVDYTPYDLRDSQNN